MPEIAGQIYQVIRPEDDARVPLTCTPEQLETIWKPAGYILADEPLPVAAIEEAPPSRKRV